MRKAAGLLLALAIPLAGCAPADPSTSVRTPVGSGGSESGSHGVGTTGPSTEPGSVASASPGTDIEGLFDVGGHRLYMRCRGTGTPTVVYLHGYIFDPSGGGSSNAGAVPGLLEPSHRTCVYDRANVGLSDPSPGPLTGASSVEDLHALLEVTGIEGPIVLVGGSYGGLIAYMYAATYPDDVRGMVLLDAVLPDEPGDPDWRSATEQLDQHTTNQQAMALAGSEPEIPMTFITIEDPDVGPIFSADAYQKAVAELRLRQQALVDRFRPGRLIVVDAPHYMEPAIPDRIAEEIEQVIAAGS